MPNFEKLNSKSNGILIACMDFRMNYFSLKKIFRQNFGIVLCYHFLFHTFDVVLVIYLFFFLKLILFQLIKKEKEKKNCYQIGDKLGSKVLFILFCYLNTTVEKM